MTMDFTTAITLDALDNSHPIEVEVKDAGAASEAFDIVSYKKGATLVRWTLSWLGEEVRS